MNLRKSTGRNLGVTAIVVLLAAAAAFGIVTSTIPDPNGVINSCYGADGSVRVITPDDKCKTNEHALNWNQTGPQGSPGPQGSQGVPGPQGAQRSVGPQSLQGPQGPAGASSATFAGSGAVVLNNISGALVKVASRSLPAGSWAVAATVNTLASPGDAAAGNADLVCELRNGASFIGGATDRRKIESGVPAKRSLSMNGGAQIPAGGGEVSLCCTTQSVELVTYSQIMTIQVGGFF